MRILYCLNSISYLGGIEIITIEKANALAVIPDVEVYIAVTDHRNNDLSKRLSHKVKLIDLDVNYFKDDWKSHFHAVKSRIIKRRKHKKKLQELVDNIKPDIIVSVGQTEKYIIPELKGDFKTIREIHYTSKYRQFFGEGGFYRTTALLAHTYDYKWKINKYDKIILLTQEDKFLNWKDNRKVDVIPNFLTIKPSLKSDIRHKKVIAIGRLVPQKNFESLIRAFRIVLERHPDWILEIYGNGHHKKNLESVIIDYRLTNHVFLKGAVNDVQKELLTADILAFSSLYEGFGMVLIEAMACGLPVVSYDCPCGPKDIISDKVDGFLITQGNESEMAEKICFLIENPDICKNMGEAAFEKSKRYLPEIIISKWLALFNSLLSIPDSNMS